MRFGWLAGRSPSIPAPRAQVSSRSTPSRLVALPDSGPGWHNAVVHLEDILSAWSLPVQLARRWMQPARELFAGQPPAELFVQLDPVDGMVTVELWDDAGAKLFGAEAYLGTPEDVDITMDRRARAS
jgi:hypothetical protein